MYINDPIKCKKVEILKEKFMNYHNLYIPKKGRGKDKAKKLMNTLALNQPKVDKIGLVLANLGEPTVTCICKRCTTPPFDTVFCIFKDIDPKKAKKFESDMKQCPLLTKKFIVIIDGCPRCLIHGKTAKEWIISCAKSLKEPGTVDLTYRDIDPCSYDYVKLLKKISYNLNFIDKFDDFCRIFKEFCEKNENLPHDFNHILWEITKKRFLYKK